MKVQDVKDTFYAALRDRVAQANPARTVAVRAVLRPGVLVVENELPGSGVDGIEAVEAFSLRWTRLAVDDGLIALGCEVAYATDGSAGAAGMDRGRALGALDADLLEALNQRPQNAAGFSVSEAVAGSAAQAASGTSIFWSDVQFGPVVVRGERLERTATVEVFGYE